MQHATTKITGGGSRRAAVALTLAVAFIAAACGSGDGNGDAAAAERSSTSEPSIDETVTSPPIVDPDFAVDAAAFIEYELQRRDIMNMSNPLAPDATGQAAWELGCEWLADQVERLRLTVPDSTDGQLPEWDAYAEATDRYWSEYETACAGYDPATYGDQPDFREPLWASEQPKQEACEDLLVALVELLPPDAAVPFCEYPPDVPIQPETYPDLPPELEGFLSGDVPPPGGSFVEIDDPTSGPTLDSAGPEVNVALWDDISTFDWFTPPFTVTKDQPWAFFAETDFISFANDLESVSGMLDVLAPSGVADPEQLVSLEEWDDTRVLPTISVPDDLTDWISRLPVVASSTPTTVGGLETTHWELEYDRDADGNSVVLFAPASGFRSYGPVIGEVVLHLWHVRHPDGPLFIVENQFTGETGLMTTPAMLDSITF